MAPALQLNQRHLPGLLLLVLPVYVSVTGAGVRATISLLFLIFVLRIAVRFASLGKPKTYVLEGISLSPFVEYVRWTLDVLQEPYEEVESVAIVGALLFGRMVPVLHVPPYTTSISNSKDIVAYLSGKHCSNPRAELLKFSQTADQELERQIWRFASHARRWIYYYCFYESGRKRNEILLKGWGMYQPTVPYWQKIVLRMLLPFLVPFTSRALRINKRSCDEGLIVMRHTFDELDKRLSDGRKYLLDTQEPSIADILWASMAGMILRPPEYAGGKVFPRSIVEVSDFALPAQAEIRALEARPAGQLVLRLYKDYRMPRH